MTPNEIEKWRETRALGKTRYILVSGVLAYGLPMFVVMTFVVNHRATSLLNVAISAVLWLIGGAVFGISMWYILERKYRKASGDLSA